MCMSPIVACTANHHLYVGQIQCIPEPDKRTIIAAFKINESKLFQKKKCLQVEVLLVINSVMEGSLCHVFCQQFCHFGTLCLVSSWLLKRGVLLFLGWG